jgi:hypothetical protein
MKDMDVVYICRSGPNEELRYSVRSVEANMPHREIWVVGQKPEWYKGNFIPVKDRNAKYENARANLKAVVNSKEISENFILMNDDFFIIRKIQKISYFYGGTLKNREEENAILTSTGSYTKLLRNTRKTLNKIGIADPLNYELHIPMILNKENFKAILEYKDCLWRSMYGNIYEVGGMDREDVKVYPLRTRDPQSYDWRNKNFAYLSTQDASFAKVHRELLFRMFKKPSSIEDEDED